MGSNRRRTCSPYDEELDSAVRSDEPADSRRSPDPETEIRKPGSLSRWVGSEKAMAGRDRCLETECMEGRAVLSRETCPEKGWCSLPEVGVRRASRAGVRAPVVAEKRGNARGAKGCRKVDV